MVAYQPGHHGMIAVKNVGTVYRLDIGPAQIQPLLTVGEDVVNLQLIVEDVEKDLAVSS